MGISRRTLMGWMGWTGGSLLGSRWLRGRVSGEGANFPGANVLGGLLESDGASAAGSGPTRWQSAAQRKREATSGITWLTHEPMEFLLRRGGDHTDHEAQRYADMTNPDNIRRMADAGIKWGRIFFYKGFGIEYERQHIDLAKRVAEQMHSLGMKVSLYMAGTMFVETLYRETPQAREWEQRDQNNQPVTYGLQVFRRYACPNEPAYREYIRRVLEIGVKELQGDEFCFDNIMLQPEPKSCRCPRCLSGFADFIRGKYPDEKSMRRRFGIPQADWLLVNQWESFTQPEGIVTVEDPVLQEWIRFRCESLAGHARSLYEITKGLKPDACVLFNIKGVFSFNRYWTNAIYHPLFAGHIDLMSFDTGGYDDRIDAATGALVSQIRSYKVARQLKCACEDSLGPELRAAVHMAFGIQAPVKGATPIPWGSGAFNVFTPIMEFFREYNDRYFTSTENVADVAVLRNWPSMAFSINANYTPVALLEQVLIQYKLPFDIIFDEQLDRIDRYRAVILANQECVSDEQMETLLKYVRGGGFVLVAGNTAEFNGWRERRTTNPLRPGRKEGRGRIVYIGEIEGELRAGGGAADANADPLTLTERPATRIVPSQWVLPVNHKELHEAISGALPGGPSLVSQAPLTTVAELVTRQDTRETIAHFVNFDQRRVAGPFASTVRLQFGGAVQSVFHFSPEADGPVALAFHESGRAVTFGVPATRVYSMVVVAQ